MPGPATEYESGEVLRKKLPLAIFTLSSGVPVWLDIRPTQSSRQVGQIPPFRQQKFWSPLGQNAGEIFLIDFDGTMRSLYSRLWADAMRRRLSRHLGLIAAISGQNFPDPLGQNAAQNFVGGIRYVCDRFA